MAFAPKGLRTDARALISGWMLLYRTAQDRAQSAAPGGSRGEVAAVGIARRVRKRAHLVTRSSMRPRMRVASASLISARADLARASAAEAPASSSWALLPPSSCASNAAPVPWHRHARGGQSLPDWVACTLSGEHQGALEGALHVPPARASMAHPFKIRV